MKEFGIVLDGKIIGQGLHVNCKVQATKTTLNGDPPAFSDFHLLNSDETDELPDGDYKVLVNNRQVHLKRKGGHFLGRV